MNGVIIAIWPIALLIVLAIAGIPLWMTLGRRHTTPGAPTGNDYVPTEPVAAVDGLTVVRKTGTADDDVAVPAQRHW